MLPGTGRNRVIVFNLLAANLIPLGPLGVEIIDVETIKVSYDCSLAGGVKAGARELLDFLVFRVIKRVKAVSGIVIEGNSTVVACCQDMCAPGKRLWDC